MANKIQFVSVTSAVYNALESKDASTLYFLSDTQELYKGSARYSFPVKTVTDFPATGESGILYVNADGLAKIWAGSAYITIGDQQEKFLSSAERHTVTAGEAGQSIYTGMNAGDIGVLFTMNNEDKLFVKLTDLVDTYTADNTSAKGVTMTVSGYNISGEVNISAESGNIAELKNDGVFVPQLEWSTLE